MALLGSLGLIRGAWGETHKACNDACAGLGRHKNQCVGVCLGCLGTYCLRGTLGKLIALSTGLRRGEILGLTWGNVDLDAGTLAVLQSLEQTQAGVRLKPPKTKKSRRKMELPPNVVQALRAHKNTQAEHRLAFGRDAYKDRGFVCAREDGDPWKPDSFSQAFVHLHAKTDLPPITFHGRRHTQASILGDRLKDLHLVSRRLGHSGIGITADLYTHRMPGTDGAAALALDDLFTDC